MTIKYFEDLPVWQKARELSKLVYNITSDGPFAADFRFREQIRAAAGSVMDNIAEGFEREGNKEFIHFLFIAKGSCAEIRSQSYRAFDNQYVDETQFNQLIEKSKEISIDLANYIKYLRNSGIKGNKFK